MPVSLIDQDQLLALRQLAGGDPGFLTSVIDAFVPQLEGIPGSLREALGEANAHAVAELAHSLKGSAGHLGAAEVARLCVLIEELARQGELTQVRPLVDQLEPAAVATRRLLEAERTKLD